MANIDVDPIMNKKVFWGIIIVFLLAAVGYGAYWWGAKKSSMSASDAAKAISDYLNQSQARAVNDCAAFNTASDVSILDVGGKYKGVWSGGKIVDVCQ